MLRLHRDVWKHVVTSGFDSCEAVPKIRGANEQTVQSLQYN
jgi:hypothetical protein